MTDDSALLTPEGMREAIEDLQERMYHECPDGAERGLTYRGLVRLGLHDINRRFLAALAATPENIPVYQLVKVARLLDAAFIEGGDAS